MPADLEHQLRDAGLVTDPPWVSSGAVWSQGRRLRRRRRITVAVGTAAAVVVLGGVAVTTLPLSSDGAMPFIGDGPVSPDELESPVQRGWSELPDAPLEPRSRHGAAWTGQELIVWGGFDRSFDHFGDGASLDPATGAWQPLPEAGLQGRAWPELHWTGEELLVFGGMSTTGRERGSNGGEIASGGGEVHFTDGARFDPQARTWQPMADFPLQGRSRAAVAWIGDELIVWGGITSLFQDPRTPLDDGAAYNPATDTWRELSPAPLAARAGATAVWTGDQLIVFGGTDEQFQGQPDGAAYDPATDRWQPIANGPTPRPSPAFNGQDAVWTGDRMLIWTGRDLAGYNPATDQWQLLPTNDADGTQNSPDAVWGGDRLLTWGGWYEDRDPTGHTDSGYAFDPDADTWTDLPDGPLASRADHTLTWTDHGLIIWGGEAPRGTVGSLVGDDFTDTNSGAIFRP